MERDLLLKFLLKRKLIIGLFITLISGLGLYSMTNLDKELFPSVTFNQTLIMIETEEMPAEDVEQFVTIPVEDILDNMEDVNSYEATSSSNNSLFIVDLADGVGDEATNEIESEVNGLTNELHGINDIMVMQASTQGQYEFFMDISGGSMEDMSAYALNVVKPRLESLKEVNEDFISGVEEKEIIITLKTKKIAEFDLAQED